MTPEPINIEALVAEVVRRLRQLAAAPDAAPPQPPPSPAPRPLAPTVAATKVAEDAPAGETHEGDLVVDVRVVTMAEIERRLSNVRRVLVRRGAVVTPSVKDDLRKRHIRLEYLAAPAPDNKSADELTIACCTHTSQGAQAAAALAHPAGASVMKFDDLRCAAQTVATIVADANRLGVLITDDPLTAVCLANRAPTARAACVADVAQLRAAMAAIGMNFLIVDPSHYEPERWRELLAVYRQGLPRARRPG